MPTQSQNSGRSAAVWKAFGWLGAIMLVFFLAGTTVLQAQSDPQPPTPAPDSLPAGQVNGESPQQGQIVGGENAAVGELPWQVMVLPDGFLCGGSLIDPQWVLTAAHCVVDDSNLPLAPSAIRVVAGEYRRSVSDGTEQQRNVSQVFVHPSYDPEMSDNDIALLRLAAPVVLGPSVGIVPLASSPAHDALVAPGVLSLVSGWGRLAEDGSSANTLQKVRLPIVSNTICNQSYGGSITANMLCAGFAAGGKDSCQGDSGGPLVVPDGGGWRLAGIVSFGNGCARPIFYGIYTRVSRFTDWIAATVSSFQGPATPTATPTQTPTATPSPTPTATPTPPAPIIRRLDPDQGFQNVPNEILISGADLRAGLAITIGGTALQDVAVDLPAGVQARAVAPGSLAPGLYDVIGRQWTFSSTLPAGYTVLDPAQPEVYADDADFWFDPQPVRAGQPVTVGLNVHYWGAAATGKEVGVEFRLGASDGDLLGIAATLPLTPALGGSQPVSIAWTAPAIGAYTVFGKVDAGSVLTESSEANNLAQWRLDVLPAKALGGDITPPIVRSLAVAGGAQTTAAAAVVLSLDATDDRGVASMYVAERTYNNAAATWVTQQATGWINYASTFTMTLRPLSGVHYLQVWVADDAGNISSGAVTARVNFLRPASTLRQRQVHVYRLPAQAGQPLQIDLATQQGDADLHMWDAGGNLLFSNKDGLALDSVQTPGDGDYQVEVHGHLDSSYTLSIAPAAAAAAGELAGNAKVLPAAPVAALDNIPAARRVLPAAPLVWRMYLPIMRR